MLVLEEMLKLEGRTPLKCCNLLGFKWLSFPFAVAASCENILLLAINHEEDESEIQISLNDIY